MSEETGGGVTAYGSEQRQPSRRSLAPADHLGHFYVSFIRRPRTPPGRLRTHSRGEVLQMVPITDFSQPGKRRLCKSRITALARFITVRAEEQGSPKLYAASAGESSAEGGPNLMVSNSQRGDLSADRLPEEGLVRIIRPAQTPCQCAYPNE